MIDLENIIIKIRNNSDGAMNYITPLYITKLHLFLNKITWKLA